MCWVAIILIKARCFTIAPPPVMAKFNLNQYILFLPLILIMDRYRYDVNQNTQQFQFKIPVSPFQ